MLMKNGEGLSREEKQKLLAFNCKYFANVLKSEALVIIVTILGFLSTKCLYRHSVSGLLLLLGIKY